MPAAAKMASVTEGSASGVRIVACVKVVPAVPSPRRLDPETLRLDRRVEAVANASDLHAVEAALRLREAGSAALGETEVVLLSMGPAETVSALRTPLAMGADRALVVSDERAAGSDLLATCRVLGAALEREQPDLVLFGQQASDSNGAVLWAAVANRLRLPMVSRVVALELADGRVRVKRRTESGVDVIESPLPCVVSVSSAVNDPRIPSFRQLKAAGDKVHQLVSLDELGVSSEHAGDAGSRTEVLALHDPPSRGDAPRIVDTGDAAERILEYLASKKLV